MKVLLLSFALSLVAVLQAQEFSVTQDIEEVTGTWYLKASASDKEIFGKRLGSVLVTSVTINTLEGGNLQVKYTARIAGHCREMTIVLEKTDQPDKYTAYGGSQVLYIIPSSVQDHCIFFWESKMRGVHFRMAKLLGREPDTNQEALEDFQNVVGAEGLNAENIFIPKQSDTCPLGSN
ncbi:von Ebner gland protein 1-like [Sigmodon hispidus]